ncbi:tyrosinase inhibitor-like [Lucilia sericata]|uniref:tyrosinase inhibitor-like n=1 Tax=Lucilia sericata TaxID=13632 RepID=UPI0018A84DDC|nr:tyrosinase inhibitor-like [Lucilia sericata]
MKFSVFIFLIVALVASLTPFAAASPILENIQTNNEIVPQKQPKECQALGGPCFYSDECCGKRCNFYAHKCTT